MTQALERVIAEQQAQIDFFKARDLANIESWKRENIKVEQFAMWAFAVLQNPESPKYHFKLKKALINMGFCPVCEERPCGCRYDD